MTFKPRTIVNYLVNPGGTSNPDRVWNPVRVTGFIILVVLVLTLSENLRPRERNFWKEVIISDGRGYYAYLPSLVLYHDIHFGPVLQREQQRFPTVSPDRFLMDAGGQVFDKYFAGEALLLLPFFLLAVVVSWLTGLPPDGYNAVFQMSVSIAALFYLFIGLWCLAGLMKLLQVKKGIAAVVLLVVVAGTNLLLYTVEAPAMSHVYSFAAVAAFMYFMALYFRWPGTRTGILAAVTLAAVILIRSADGIIVLLIPFLAGDRHTMEKGIRTFWSQPAMWIPALLLFALILFIQPLLWHAGTGHWLLWGYRGEGFYFTHPAVLKTLFSFQKGFFIYTPAALLSLAGLIPLFRKSPWQFTWVVCFLAVLVWLVSAWWNWYYGDSFGQRVFIDFYVLFALLLALLLQSFRGRAVPAVIMAVLIAALGSLNLLQSWQYARGIIHPYAMNRDKYRMVFLRTGQEYRNLFSGPRNVVPYGVDLKNPLAVWYNDFEQTDSAWITSGRTDWPGAHSGHAVALLGSEHHFSSALLITGDDRFTGIDGLYMKAVAWINDLDRHAADSAMLVISLADQWDKIYYWDSCPLNEMPEDRTGRWRHVSFGLELPTIKDKDDKLKIFVWNKGTGRLLVDDFKIEIYK